MGKWVIDCELSSHDERYPRRFREGYQGRKNSRPPSLYCWGNLELLDNAGEGRVIALIGSRHASPDKTKKTRELARRLAEHGWVVVSGFAPGIDRAAFDGALDHPEGRTIAVLAQGVGEQTAERTQKSARWSGVASARCLTFREERSVVGLECDVSERRHRPPDPSRYRWCDRARADAAGGQARAPERDVGCGRQGGQARAGGLDPALVERRPERRASPEALSAGAIGRGSARRARATLAAIVRWARVKSRLETRTNTCPAARVRPPSAARRLPRRLYNLRVTKAVAVRKSRLRTTAYERNHPPRTQQLHLLCRASGEASPARHAADQPGVLAIVRRPRR